MTTSEHPIDGLEAVDTTIAVVDGRVAMNAGGDASVRVETPDPEPLTRIETHATIYVTGDDYRAAVDLNAAQREALLADLTPPDATVDTEGRR